MAQLHPAARIAAWGLLLFWILGVTAGWAFGVALIAGVVPNPKTGRVGSGMALEGYFFVLLTTLMLA